MLTWRPLVLSCFVLGTFSSAFVACGSDDEHRQAAADGGEANVAGAPSASAGETADTGGAPPTGAAGASAVEDDLGVLKEFCQRFADTECSAREACYGATEGCVADTIASCHLYARAEVLPALAAGQLEYDAAKADECFSAPLEGFCSTNNLWFQRACREAFSGAVAGDDDPCYRVYFLGNDLETCESGHCSATPKDECGSGRCVPFLTDDEPCRDAENVVVEPGCGPGRLCDPMTKLCFAEQARYDECTNAGEPCNGSFPRLFCVPRADGMPGLECDTGRVAGALCGTDNGAQLSIACNSLVCIEDHCADENEAGARYCFSGSCPAGQACFAMPDNPTCAPASSEGDPCAPGAHECAEGLACAVDDPEVPTVGSCRALAQLGEVCAGVGCIEGLRCLGDGDDSSCATIAQLGDPCTTPEANECVMGLVCLQVTSKCGQPIALNETCSIDGDCDRGLYCDDEASKCRPWKRNGESCSRQGECVYQSGCTDAGLCDSTCTP